jgi:hypothetical protein
MFCAAALPAPAPGGFIPCTADAASLFASHDTCVGGVDNGTAGDATVDHATVDEATVDEATVDEATVEDAALDEAAVDEASRDNAIEAASAPAAPAMLRSADPIASPAMGSTEDGDFWLT